MTLIIPILKHNWKLSELTEATLGSVLFFGCLAGSLISELISKKFGKKQAILYLGAFECILGITSPLITNSIAFIICRTFFGLVVGATIPLVISTVAEVTP